MTARIRAFRPDDTSDVYAVCLRTGADGADATGRYLDPDLLGHVWAGRYLALEPQHALVLEDEDGVAGYVLAVLDTSAFDAAAEQAWWPALRARYADPAGRPGRWSRDERLAHLVHHPPRTPADVLDRHPSHLHLDLLPRRQGQGLGRALAGAVLDLLAEAGSRGVHVGVSPFNARALGFYRALGFHRLGQDPAVAWLGREL